MRSYQDRDGAQQEQLVFRVDISKTERYKRKKNLDEQRNEGKPMDTMKWRAVRSNIG